MLLIVLKDLIVQRLLSVASFARHEDSGELDKEHLLEF